MPSVTTPSAPTDHYTIISADCHAGGSHAMYREYLDPAYLEDFDAWRGKYKNPYRDLRDTTSASATGTTSGAQSDQEADGVVGEVVFPNTVPPFFPSFVLFARPPMPDEYEHRLAGIRAHNRWLVDFCADYPDRRAGIGQIFLNDVDDAIDDVALDQGARAARRHPAAQHPARREVGDAALRPRLRPPLGAVRGARDPGQRPRRHRLARLRHATPTAALLQISEVGLLLAATVRAVHPLGRLRALPAAQVRHDRDGLRLDPAAARAARRHDREHPRHRSIGELRTRRSTSCTRSATEYFHQNCWVGVSQPGPADAAVRKPWAPTGSCGAATTRTTRGRGRSRVSTCGRCSTTPTRRSCRPILAGNAAKLYDFDLAALQPIADQYGPTVAEIAEPLEVLPENANLALIRGSKASKW